MTVFSTEQKGFNLFNPLSRYRENDTFASSLLLTSKQVNNEFSLDFLAPPPPLLPSAYIVLFSEQNNFFVAWRRLKTDKSNLTRDHKKKRMILIFDVKMRRRGSEDVLDGSAAQGIDPAD